jgi:uncharacterized protein (TIGR02453 family)
MPPRGGRRVAREAVREAPKDDDDEPHKEEAEPARKRARPAGAPPATAAAEDPPSAELTAGYAGPRALPTAAVTWLRGLQSHNDREWFKAHQTQYDAAREAFVALLGGVAAHLERLDPELGRQDARAATFRVFRDIRFTNDKTPYKTCLSGALARGGRKSPHACYYLHLEPGDASFVGGGMWCPDGAQLKSLREAIAQGGGADLQRVLDTPAFQRHFGPGGGLFHAKASRLVTAPKGFARDHPYLPMLQLKSFTVHRSLPDALLTSPALLETVVGSMAAMTPLINLLNDLTGLT